MLLFLIKFIAFRCAIEYLSIFLDLQTEPSQQFQRKRYTNRRHCSALPMTSPYTGGLCDVRRDEIQCLLGFSCRECILWVERNEWLWGIQVSVAIISLTETLLLTYLGYKVRPLLSSIPPRITCTVGPRNFT